MCVYSLKDMMISEYYVTVAGYRSSHQCVIVFVLYMMMMMIRVGSRLGRFQFQVGIGEPRGLGLIRIIMLFIYFFKKTFKEH